MVRPIFIPLQSCESLLFFGKTPRSAPHGFAYHTFFFALASVAAFLTTSAVCQSAPSGSSPVGHWVAEHPSTGGIGSWWDFQPGGKVKMYVGAIVTAPVSHTADTVTVPSGTVDGPPVVLHYRIVGDTLTMGKDNSEASFTRVGIAPSPSDPLLGRWRPNPPKTPATNEQAAAYEKAMANGLYVFSPDNTQSVRIPFTSRNGTWDPAAHTLQIEGMPRAYSFHREGNKLVLSQPPDAQKTDTYLHDPLFP